MVATNNAKILPFIARTASVTGEIYEKDGMTMIRADEIRPAPNFGEPLLPFDQPCEALWHRPAAAVLLMLTMPTDTRGKGRLWTLVCLVPRFVHR